MGAVISLETKAEHNPKLNEDAVKIVEGVLENIRAGRTIAVAFVEVSADGAVMSAYESNNHFHQLHSGVVRLAYRLVSDCN